MTDKQSPHTVSQGNTQSCRQEEGDKDTRPLEFTQQRQKTHLHNLITIQLYYLPSTTNYINPCQRKQHFQIIYPPY